MIIALSGRRVDANDAKQPRFPLANVDAVRRRLRAYFQENGATSLVCSAACGTDLLALSEAGSLGLRRRAVLPFGRERFRQTSVTDRPGDWGGLYDSILNELAATGDVIVLGEKTGDDTYVEANQAILREAISQGQSGSQPVTAILVWEGKSRGEGDFTEGFGTEARNLGLRVEQILTTRS